MRKTIADHAEDVLRETGNDGVMHGDSALLDMIARRAGVNAQHPLDRWKAVLAGLERSSKFRKSYVRCSGLVRCFTLVDAGEKL